MQTIFVNILFLLFFFLLVFLGENEGLGPNRQQVHFLGWEGVAVRCQSCHKPVFAPLDLSVFIFVNVCVLPVSIKASGSI